MVPYVSSSIMRLKKKMSSTGAEAFKADVKSVVSKGMEDFLARLDRGQIKINNVSDFEKLVKLGMLVYGEPTERTEVTTNVEEVEQEEIVHAIKGTPEFEAIKNKIAAQLNQRNEQKG